VETWKGTCIGIIVKLLRAKRYTGITVFLKTIQTLSPPSLPYPTGSKPNPNNSKKKHVGYFLETHQADLRHSSTFKKKEQYKHLKHVSQKHSITHIVFSARHQSVIINSSDDKLKMYSVPNLDLVRVFFHPQRTFPLRCCIDVDSKIVITGSEDGQFRIFDIESGVLLNSIQAHTNTATAIASVDFSQEGMIVSAASDGEVRVWTTHIDS